MEKRTHIEDDCPACHSAGAKIESLKIREAAPEKDERNVHNWPLQIKLVGTVAPFLDNAELLVAADCTAFAVKDFHERFLGEKKLVIGCPKLDGAPFYVEKLTQMFRDNNIKKVSCLRMEVPCCGGMTMILKEAIKNSGKEIPLEEIIVGIKGQVLSERPVDYLG